MAKKRSPADAARWEDFGKRGNGMCYPNSDACRELLTQYGLEGIRYDDFDPDFTPVAEATVEIPHMTKYRTRRELLEGADRVILNKEIGPDGESLAGAYTDLSHAYAFEGNFEQADAALAEEWTKIQKDGHGWSPADIANYREANKLTWHERYDCLHMDLVPQAIHDDFEHTGGVSRKKEEERYLEEIGEDFYGADDAQTSVWHEGMEDEDDADEAHAEEGCEEEALADQRGCAMLHMILTVSLLLSFVVSFMITGPADFVQGLLWLLSQLLPYGLFFLLCYKCEGLPRFLENSFGGVLLAAFFMVFQVVLGPQLVEFLYAVYLIALTYVAIRMVSCFAPEGGGTLTIERVDEDGYTTTETRTVYGDMDAAVSQAQRELRREGYDDIR